MKPYKITIFIFSCIALLAVLAGVFPKDGIRINDDTIIEFASLNSYIGISDHSPSVPDTLAQQDTVPQEKEIILTKEDSMQLYLNDLQKIQLPFVNSTDSNVQIDWAYLDAFYESLVNADSTCVNIVHYGDSQLEGDRISQTLRMALQKQYGGGGVGLLPFFPTIGSMTMSEQTEPEPTTRYMVYGAQSLRRPQSKHYGPMGQVAVVNGTYKSLFYPATKKANRFEAQYYNRFLVLAKTDSVCTITVNKQKKQLTPSDDMQILCFYLTDSTTNLQATVEGKADMYGYRMQCEKGITVDNIPLRGCSGTIFTMIDPQQLKSYFKQTNTKLIILQFGGNSVPYIKSGKQIDTYVNQLTTQVKYLKKLAPDAKMLFIGPSDMTTKKQGERITYPLLPDLDNRLMLAMRQNGVAYWSMFQAMGGQGGMIKWVQDGLAGNDYIHFSRKGATKMGEMLTEVLLAGQEYYLYRLKKQLEAERLEAEQINLQTDSNLQSVK